MAFRREKMNSDRLVATSTDNNTLTSKSDITKFGETICGEEWPTVAELDGRPWSTVVAKENNDSTTRQTPKQKFNVERTKHGEKTWTCYTTPPFVTMKMKVLYLHVTFIQLSQFLEEKGLDVSFF